MGRPVALRALESAVNCASSVSFLGLQRIHGSARVARCQCLRQQQAQHTHTTHTTLATHNTHRLQLSVLTRSMPHSAMVLASCSKWPYDPGRWRRQVCNHRKCTRTRARAHAHTHTHTHTQLNMVRQCVYMCWQVYAGKFEQWPHLSPNARVKANLEALAVDVVCKRLHAAWEQGGVWLQMAGIVARVGRPAVVPARSGRFCLFVWFFLGGRRRVR